MAIGNQFQRPGSGNFQAAGRKRAAKPVRRAAKPKAAKRRSARKKRT